MRKSTIKLTKHELNFALDKAYPLAKHQIGTKATQLLQKLGQQLTSQFAEHEWIKTSEYKISKGDNYEQMPYQVLDYPQINKQLTFCTRTLFWWGNYFSCTMIVSTSAINLEQTAILLSGQSKIKLWTGNHLWDFNLNNKNEYTAVKKLSADKILSHLQSKEYLKLSVKIPLKQFEHLPELAIEVYTRLLNSTKKRA